MRKPFGFDTETHLFRAGVMAPRIVCASIAGVGTAPELKLREDAMRWTKGLLEHAAEGHAVLAIHNAGYDMTCLLEEAQRAGDTELASMIWRAYDGFGIHCTRMRERLIDICKGRKQPQYDLAFIAKRRLGRVLEKDTWRTGYEAFDGVPLERWPEGAKKYALDDSQAHLDVWMHQEQEAAAIGYGECWSDEVGRQSAFAFALQLMKCRGVAIDQERVAALRAGILPKMDEARKIMLAHGILRAKNKRGDLSKDTKLIQALVEQTWLGEGPVPKTETGRIAMDADTIELCDHPGLVATVEFSHYEKMLSAFVDHLAAAGDLPVHADFDCLGTDTGRTSCRKPNLQQQPREPGVRECIRAREGWVLIACDYDANEARTFAEVLMAMFGRSNLARRFKEDPDYDPHSDFVSRQLQIGYDEAIARKKAKDPAFKDMRQKAKAVIYGVPGGMGEKTLIAYARSNYGVELTREESKALRGLYFEFEPTVRDYFNTIGNWTNLGDATIRHIYSGRPRGACYFSRGANSLFQGLASDGAKNALWEVTKRAYGAPGTEGSPLFGTRPVVFMHDEILIEAPAEYAHEAAVELERVMCEAMEAVTPHVPARASPALMRNWSKSADAVFDADGRYIAWEDRPKKKEKAA